MVTVAILVVHYYIIFSKIETISDFIILYPDTVALINFKKVKKIQPLLFIWYNFTMWLYIERHMYDIIPLDCIHSLLFFILSSRNYIAIVKSKV